MSQNLIKESYSGKLPIIILLLVIWYLSLIQIDNVLLAHIFSNTIFIIALFPIILLFIKRKDWKHVIMYSLGMLGVMALIGFAPLNAYMEYREKRVLYELGCNRSVPIACHELAELGKVYGSKREAKIFFERACSLGHTAACKEK